MSMLGLVVRFDLIGGQIEPGQVDIEYIEKGADLLEFHQAALSVFVEDDLKDFFYFGKFVVLQSDHRHTSRAAEKRELVQPFM
jgi:hypothetical protein